MIDFDCIFEKGKSLPVPETVPFRLTRNFIDAFGMLMTKGTFTKTCEEIMKIFHENRRSVIGFLSSFIHDPIIEQNMSQSSQSSTSRSKSKQEKELSSIKEKLRLIDSSREITYTIEQLINHIINTATEDEYLKNMYIGWQSYM